MGMVTSFGCCRVPAAPPSENGEGHSRNGPGRSIDDPGTSQLGDRKPITEDPGSAVQSAAPAFDLRVDPCLRRGCQEMFRTGVPHTRAYCARSWCARIFSHTHI